MFVCKSAIGYEKLQKIEDKEAQNFVDEVTDRMPSLVRESSIIYSPTASADEIYDFLSRYGPKSPKYERSTIGYRSPSPTVPGRELTSSDSDDVMSNDGREAARKE